jgi:hypothetical protein
MVVDPSGPGEHYTLYRGESRVVAYDYFPTFNADGSVWIGTVGGGAVTRFAPDGRELESFDGAHLVMESADGRSRSYSLSGAGALIVERDGVRRTLTGTVVRRAFSPDGHRIAYYVHHDEHYAASLHVLDIPSGETWMLAEDIDPCRCDLTRNPTWSASGDYLAFIDYGDPTRDEPSDYGHYVVSVAGAEPLDVSSFVGWIQIDGVDLLVTNEPPSLHDPRTDSHLPIPIAGADVSYVSGIVDDRLLAAWIDLPSSARAFVLLDPRTGTELARWRHGGRIALTDGGPANAVSPSTRRPPAARDCSGFWIEHPALVEPACFADSRIGAWSPDGTRFAAIGRSGNDWWVEVWTAAEGVRYHFDIPGSEVTLVGWSPDGAYLLVTWGVGV